MVRVMAVGVFDLLHAGHLHYLEQAKSLGTELVVVVAHDDTVRSQKHEPVTNQELRCRMVKGLKPVDEAIVGNSPGTPIFDILNVVKPNVIALGYDQKHSIDSIRNGLDEHGFSDVELTKGGWIIKMISTGRGKLLRRILDLWPNSEGGPYEED